MSISKFEMLVRALKPLCEKDGKIPIENAVRIVLEKYSKEWPDPYQDSNYKRLYYRGLNSSVTQYLENNVDTDKFKKFIDEATYQQREAILEFLKDFIEFQPEPLIDGVPFCCVNLMNNLVNEAKYGQNPKQQKKPTASGHSRNGKIDLTIQDEKGIFDKTFDQVRAVKLPSQNSGMRIFALLPVGGIYCHKQLVKLLRKNLGRYILSRKSRSSEDVDIEELTVEAITELRNFLRKCDPQTLLGEMLIYIFLEHCENAPKIFTRAEFYKHNHSIEERSIFARETPDGWQLIVGTSNLNRSLDIALSEALEECEQLKNQCDFGDGPYSARVIRDEMLDTSFDLEQARKVNSLIFPKKREKPLGEVESYGVFLGYRAADTYNENLNQLLLADADKVERFINKYIDDHGLSKHPLYVYLLPLKDPKIESDRIMDLLVGK